MNEYRFTLDFELPEKGTDIDALVERLYEAGCDDALVGIGKPDYISLLFSREAPSFAEAVVSAISNVKQAVPKAKLVEFEVEEELNAAELADLGSVEEIDTLMLQGVVRQQLGVLEEATLQ